jgi:hypothetical protein
MLHWSMDTRVKVSIFIPQEVESSIKREADEQNISFSSLASDYLELGVKTRQELGLTELLGPKLQATIKQEFRGIADRLANLMSRTALETTSAKELLFQLVVKEFGAEKSLRYRDKAWQVAVDELKKPLESLLTLLKGNGEANG